MNLQCEEGRASGPTNSTVVVEETKYYIPSDGGDPYPVQENVTYPITNVGGFNSSSGCYLVQPELNNSTEGSQIIIVDKAIPNRHRKYDASYVGYSGLSFATATVSGNLRDRPQCGARGNGTFFATFTRNKQNERDPETKITAIFCKPSYYEQDVEATINAMTGQPLHVVLQGTKRHISADILNATVFEDTLASGECQILTREAVLPMNRIPQCLEYLYNSDLTPSVFAAPPIMTIVMSESRDRFQELLDPQKLGKAYELVYQLFFARAMNDILKPNFSVPGSVTTGLRGTKMEAVVLEPIFVYLVEAFLGLVSLAMLTLMYMGYFARKNGRLVNDPGKRTLYHSIIYLFESSIYGRRHVYGSKR
jgi:hypothetical protein